MGGVEGEMGDIGMCDVKDAENKKMEIAGIHIENLGIMWAISYEEMYQQWLGNSAHLLTPE